MDEEAPPEDDEEEEDAAEDALLRADEVDEGGDDGGDGGGGAVGGGGAGPAERLQRKAEDVLSSLLCSAQSELVRDTLLALLPSGPCSASDGLDAQLHREACYSALGIGAWSLQ